MAEEHTTSGSPRREAHSVSGEGLRYSLDQERRELESQRGQTSAGRTSKTLAKTGTLRVTLIDLRAGTTVDPRATAGAATIQVLQGRVSLGAVGQDVQAGAGELVILDQNLRDPLRAEEDSMLLVTIAWDEGAGAWDEDGRAGRR